MLKHLRNGGGFVRSKWGCSSPCVICKEWRDVDGKNITIILELLYQDGRTEPYLPVPVDRFADDWIAVDAGMNLKAYEMGFVFTESSPENAFSIPTETEE